MFCPADTTTAFTKAFVVAVLIVKDVAFTIEATKVFAAKAPAPE